MVFFIEAEWSLGKKILAPIGSSMLSAAAVAACTTVETQHHSVHPYQFSLSSNTDLPRGGHHSRLLCAAGVHPRHLHARVDDRVVENPHQRRPTERGEVEDETHPGHV